MRCCEEGQSHRYDAVREWRAGEVARDAQGDRHAQFSLSIQNSEAMTTSCDLPRRGPPLAIENMPALDRIVGADAWRQAFPSARCHDHRSSRSVWAQLQRQRRRHSAPSRRAQHDPHSMRSKP